MSRLFRAELLIIAVLILCQPFEAEGARWYEDYEMALEEIGTGVCSPVAIEMLGAAVVDKPKPRRYARTYAQLRIDYLPYLNLARAHLACGNLELAEQYLERSRSYGVAKAERLDSIATELAAIRAASVATPSPPPIDREAVDERVQSAGRQIEAAAQALARVDSALDDSPGPAARKRWSSERDECARRLEQARLQLRESHNANDLLGLADSASTARSVVHDLERLEEDIRDGVEEWRIAQFTPTPSPTPLVRVVVPTSTPTPVQPALTEEPDPPPIPDALFEAAEAYFSGRYQRVIAVLDGAEMGEGRVLAGAHLLRGAAHVALEGISGNADELEKAKAEFMACRDAAPSVRPDPDLFSPRVVEVFDAVASRP